MEKHSAQETHKQLLQLVQQIPPVREENRLSHCAVWMCQNGKFLDHQ